MSETFYQIVTDNQWEIIESCLPKTKMTGRPGLNPRMVFNAILFVLESGAKWRYIPKEYGNWNSIFHKFRKWIEAGVFEKILQSLVENSRKYYLLEMDSTFCKVHQDATGAIKKLGSQSIGVSRGGKTTKIHALVNEHFQLIKVHDREVAIDLLEGIDLQDKTVLADSAFIAEKIRNYIESNNGNVCIPDKFNSVTKHDFQRIKKFRHIATRYDKLAVCFLNFVLLAAFLLQF